MLIESWQLADRQRILDTSLSLSELNALRKAEAAPQPSPLPQRPPPPLRPPETYRRKLQGTRAHTEEPPRREVRESSKGPSSRFLGFLRRPELKKKQLETQMNEEENGGWNDNRRAKNEKEEQKELLEAAAELKWLIVENSRRLTELCLEEAVRRFDKSKANRLHVENIRNLILEVGGDRGVPRDHQSGDGLVPVTKHG